MNVSRCKLCASGNLRTGFRMDRYGLQILRCGDCGFLFVDYINTNYLVPHESKWDFTAHAPQLALKFSRYCDEISRHFTFADASVLDVGAGGGDFLHQAELRGAKVLGLDLDLAGIHFARETYGITILPQPVEEYAPVQSSYDAVTLWEVIEHVNDPNLTISAIAEMLKPGGWIFLSTPCLDSLWDRAGFLLYSLTFGLVQFPLLYRFSWAHLQIFSRKHLAHLLERWGFEIAYFEQRTEFTYPTDQYLGRLRSTLMRKFVAALWNGIHRFVPIGNKMIVYARKRDTAS